MSNRLKKYVFFLGGHDLEMVTIRDLLKDLAITVFDINLLWGAKSSVYRKNIQDALNAGKTPVLVEIEDDMNLPKDKVIFIDHHEERAGSEKPTALHQVFSLLNLSSEMWSSDFDLVAANDRGYITELEKIGATREDIIRIRAEDRKAQQITPEQEEQGRLALAKTEVFLDGRLTVAHLTHSRTAVATDFLHKCLGGPGYENLLVFCPDETDFFGEGELVMSLHAHFPGSWMGGALPERGFWGYSEALPSVLECLKNAMTLSRKGRLKLSSDAA